MSKFQDELTEAMNEWHTRNLIASKLTGYEQKQQMQLVDESVEAVEDLISRAVDSNDLEEIYKEMKLEKEGI